MNIGVIYKLTCTKCEKVYIGQTQFDVNHRMNQHKNGLRKEGNSAAADHILHNKEHTIDFDKPEVLAQEKYSNQLNFNQTDAFRNTDYGLLFWSSPKQASFDTQFLQRLITAGHSIDCNNEVAINPLSFDYMHSSSNTIYPYRLIKSNHPSNSVRVSPLINAIVHNHFELAAFTLELGADVNFLDEEKRTLLMYTVRQNNINMVRLLHDRHYNTLDSNRYSTNNGSIRPLQTRKKPKGFFHGVTTTSAQRSDRLENDDNIDENETETIKTSSIDLDANGALGRTCIHHLVQPFPDGSYINNRKLLKLLHSFGASLTQIDSSGLSSFDISVNIYVIV
ncbi:unnamed protein product [Didymodactylos carnosus]|uniref:GIY-YIG domain-containing protein n=1 Tax=Didymodactylos carnosus TaxID=1234261 RepID=A0A815QM48_9BILA|nr:unnamed protein product [Didymodactylos carnosus]CAF4333478.1 unnamed protein product [Didymodactylos carnosus]